MSTSIATFCAPGSGVGGGGTGRGHTYGPRGPLHHDPRRDHGTVTLALFDPSRAGMSHSPGSGAVALAVPDVSAARDALKGERVEFVADLIDSGTCHQAILRDTEGNTLILHHIHGR